MMNLQLHFDSLVISSNVECRMEIFLFTQKATKSPPLWCQRNLQENQNILLGRNCRLQMVRFTFRWVAATLWRQRGHTEPERFFQTEFTSQLAHICFQIISAAVRTVAIKYPHQKAVQ